jgi:hypothetical protein
MAEGINRYTPYEELNRLHAAQYEKQKPDIWTACLWASLELAAEWAEDSAERWKGEAGAHITCRVKGGKIQIECSRAAHGWKRIQGIINDPTPPLAYDHPIEVLLRVRNAVTEGA